MYEREGDREREKERERERERKREKREYLDVSICTPKKRESLCVRRLSTRESSASSGSEATSSCGGRSRLSLSSSSKSIAEESSPLSHAPSLVSIGAVAVLLLPVVELVLPLLCSSINTALGGDGEDEEEGDGEGEVEGSVLAWWMEDSLPASMEMVSAILMEVRLSMSLADRWTPPRAFLEWVP